MKKHHSTIVALLVASSVAGCASAPGSSSDTSSAAATPARGKLLLSGNDGKLPMIDGVYKVANPHVMDTLTVLDVSSMPPKKLVDLVIQHTVTAPPMTIAITPDEKLALVSAPNRVDPKDPAKVATDNYMQIVDLDASPPRIIDRVDLGRHPLGVAINGKGTLAMAASQDGNISVLSIDGKRVKLIDTIRIGEPASSPRAVAITPDGKWALASKRGDDSVAVLSIDGEKATYTKRDITVGNNPYGIEISADGKFAAVADVGRGDGSLDSVTIIDLTRTPFRAVDYVTVGQSPEGIAISPDSKYVAVNCQNGTNRTKDHPYRGESGLLLVFAIDHGQASKVAEIPTHGHNGQGVAFTPDGKYIVVQNYVEKELVFYRFDGHSLTDSGVHVAVSGYPAGLRTVR